MNTKERNAVVVPYEMCLSVRISSPLVLAGCNDKQQRLYVFMMADRFILRGNARECEPDGRVQGLPAE